MATPLKISERMTEAERQTRVDLAACYRLCALHGWSDMSASHISARVPGSEDHFLINPFGVHFEEITASSLIKIDLEGRIIGETPYRFNPAGFVIHSAIHMSSQRHFAVLHTHTIANAAVSMQKCGLLPHNIHALVVYGDLAYHDFEGPTTRLDERERIVESLGDRRIMLLRNHGGLTVGSTIAEAFQAHYNLEKACRVQLAFQSSGQEMIELAPELIEATAARARTKFWAGGEVDPLTTEWPALLRKLERTCPDYRD